MKKQKKAVCLLLVLLLLFSLIPAASAADLPYRDVKETAWYYNAVKYCYEKGLMLGTGDGTQFSPNMQCSRAMIAVILYSIEEKPEVTYEARFPDVPAQQWYTDAVIWAARAGIVSGYDTGKFGTSDNITREQLAAMLMSYAKYKNLDTSAAASLDAFPDAAKTGAWAKNAVCWAVGAGLISGKQNGGKTLLDPKGLATRAEVAAILMSFCEKLLKETPSDLPEHLLEGWTLNDGGTDAAIASELPDGTAAEQHWGVWLPTDTFGLTLDFSTEGSYAKAQNTRAALDGSFSVSAWMLAPVREADDRVLVQQGCADAPEYTLYISGSDNTLCFTAADLQNTQSSGVNIVDGKWHHVLVSVEGNTLTYYIDGAEVKTCTVSGKLTVEDTDVILGSDASFAHGLDGSLAQVRIFGTAVLPEEATQIALLPSDNEEQTPYLDLKHGIVLDRRQYSGPTPGLNDGQTVREDDIINCINMGFDHVKLLLTPNHLIAEDGSLIAENLSYITQVIGYVEKHDYRCILCIHPEGDFKKKYLGDLDNFERLCKWYGELAAYIGEHWSKDYVALQLMTEPNSNPSEVSWSWMSDRMWGAVRNVLPEHTLLTSSDLSGNLEYLKMMSPATDPNLIYTFTTYEPYTIGWYFYNNRDYGVYNAWSYVHDIPYPVEEGVDYTDAIEYAIDYVPEEWKAGIREQLWAYIRGEYDSGWPAMTNHYDSLYNANWHMLRAKSLDDWRQKYGGNISIMCVEFGCMDHLTPGVLWQNVDPCFGISPETRLLFVHDMRSSFDAYDIGWDYWSYNEAHTVFDIHNHTYGVSPSPENAIYMFDYEMLQTGLGITPLVSADNQKLLMIDEVQRSIDWIGSAMKYETAGGHQDGADWLSATASKTEDLVFFRGFPATDATAFADGYLHLWVYVNDLEALRGGMVEISSAGTVDEEELWWPLRDYVTQSGWNEILLPIYGAQKQGTRDADLTQMDTIRIVMSMSAGGIGGIDSVFFTTHGNDPYCDEGLIVDLVQSADRWQGDNITYVPSDGYAADADWVRAERKTAGDMVLFYTFPARNATQYRDGFLHMWVYVDDVTKLTNGMIEITSAATVDQQELWWPICSYVTKSGWNELYLPFAEAQSQGGSIDFRKLNCMRVVMMTNAAAVGGVDEIYICAEKP